ncbi:hypothetical protein IWQ60_001749 [Tieghemiomyces parasiticus]|uniref:Uncharacterized protein n=1 Tax=Tieghemiomyces parasiticus TaxID=78921 RepID=A0A9W8DWB1_9FUNG|nr:hypothetical protein IWQ60_001749 [Tieghemiomyces parasiticus]
MPARPLSQTRQARNEEDAQLREHTKNHGMSDWAPITQVLANRSATECHRRVLAIADPGVKRRFLWSPKDDERLNELVEQYSRDFKAVVEHFPNCNVNTIRRRHDFINRPAENLKWNPEEIAKLREAAEQYGTESRWKDVAEAVGTRSAHQCYKRWYNLPFQGENRGRWNFKRDIRMLMCVFDARPRLLLNNPAYYDLCAKYRRTFIDRPFFAAGEIPDQAPPGHSSVEAADLGEVVASPDPAHPATGKATGSPSAPPPCSASAAESSAKPADAEPAEEPLLLWHQIALKLDNQDPDHPFYCKKHFRLLLEGAELIARLTPEECDRLIRIMPHHGPAALERVQPGSGGRVNVSQVISLKRARKVIDVMSKYLEKDRPQGSEGWFRQTLQRDRN